MEQLVERLQNEVGLSEEQAIESILVMKEFMDNEGLKVDWSQFFQGKYKDFMKNAKTYARDLSDKVSDTTEDLGIKAKRAARDFSKKIYDKLSDAD